MRNFVSMTTVTHGEIIDLNVRIENPGRPGDKRIVFFHVSAVLLLLGYPYLIIILGF